MVITEIISWWYISGWKIFVRNIRNWGNSLAEFFSMNSLIRTLFKPYRQISASIPNSSSISLDLKFHAFIDRSISRCIGFISRFFLLIIGTILIIISTIFNILLLIIWPLMPFLPIAGIILTISGVNL